VGALLETLLRRGLHSLRPIEALALVHILHLALQVHVYFVKQHFGTSYVFFATKAQYSTARGIK
jgi:hypothetical protein